MLPTLTALAFLGLSVSSLAAAHPDAHPRPTPVMNKRQNTAGATAVPTPSYRATLAAPDTAGLAAIGTATSAEVQMALPTTYAAGSPAPLRGAPPLPSLSTLNPALFPPLDRQPPVNSPEVQAWVAQIDWTRVPQIAPNGLNGCSNTTVNAAAIAAAGEGGNCWWTCGGCTRATDVTFCPTPETWGVSYDDGPSPYTPRLLHMLDQIGVKGTFFIVGSRAVSRPEMVQYEYMTGHQLSVHTWAHPPLTEMTNEQIVAELGWTMKAIKDITGVTPNTFRPPYGDMDDRVRYIALQMGLTPLIWTSTPTGQFDSRDYQIGAGVVTAANAYNNFFNYVTATTATLRHGFIVLQHDLYQQSVDLAVNFFLPHVVSAGRLAMQPIATCLGMTLEEAYMETASNTTRTTQTSTTLIGASGVGFVPNVGAAHDATAIPSSSSTTTVTVTSPTSTPSSATQQAQTTSSAAPTTTASSKSAAQRVTVGDAFFTVLAVGMAARLYFS